MNESEGGDRITTSGILAVVGGLFFLGIIILLVCIYFWFSPPQSRQTRQLIMSGGAGLIGGRNTVQTSNQQASPAVDSHRSEIVPASIHSQTSESAIPAASVVPFATAEIQRAVEVVITK